MYYIESYKDIFSYFLLPFISFIAMLGLLRFLWTTYSITDIIGGPPLTYVSKGLLRRQHRIERRQTTLEHTNFQSIDTSE